MEQAYYKYFLYISMLYYCVCLNAFLTVYVYMLYLLCMSICFTYCVCLYASLTVYVYILTVYVYMLEGVQYRLHESICFTYCICLYASLIVYVYILTVNVYMLEGVQYWLHELVVEGDDLVVVELQPLDGVEVLKCVQRELGEAAKIYIYIFTSRAGHVTIFQLCDNDNASTEQSFRDKKNSKNVMSQCLDGAATTNIVQ